MTRTDRYPTKEGTRPRLRTDRQIDWMFNGTPTQNSRFVKIPDKAEGGGGLGSGRESGGGGGFGANRNGAN